MKNRLKVFAVLFASLIFFSYGYPAAAIILIYVSYRIDKKE